jgi:hypothetical protein
MANIDSGRRPEAQRENDMGKLIYRRGGYRYVYDEDGHVEQVDEINAKMTNITVQTWPDFESAKRAVENSELKWREPEISP